MRWLEVIAIGLAVAGVTAMVVLWW